jgi:hypothetical protein
MSKDATENKEIPEEEQLVVFNVQRLFRSSTSYISGRCRRGKDHSGLFFSFPCGLVRVQPLS